MTQTILLVGATGMFGSRIANELSKQPDARMRLMVRSSEDPKKKSALQPLLDAGAEIIVGDLDDEKSLDRATQGVDVIISAVQGGPDVMVDGQVALAKAGKRNGVRRIQPSDYALDLFKATPGEHMMFDLRAKADAQIAELGIDQVNVLQGAFMDMFLPGHGAIDLDKGTIGFYGDGNLKIEVTSVDDTAKMVARIALDRDVAPGKFAFAGDHVTFREAADIVSRATGKTIKPASMGSEADLRAAMKKADAQHQVTLAYLLYMTNGQTALTELKNERYPDVHFEGLADFVKRSVNAKAPG